MEEDNALIDRYLAGDAGALGTLVEKHQKRLYAFVYMTVRDMETAKDLTQETLIRAVRGIGAFKRESSFRTWLYQIALNVGRRHFSRNRDRGMDLSETLARTEPDALSALLDRERRDRLTRGLGALPERQRTAVVLRVYEGLSVSETAGVMGCSAGAVKAHFHHAVKKLGLLLGGGAS